ncbi:MAG: MMPL family transporter [Chloroflexi bacterium]|nr:MAG: MMPL family transporter [Chloroflexota bacterium]
MSTTAPAPPRAGQLARRIVRHPRRVIVAVVVLALVAGILGGPVAGLLSPGGFSDPNSESAAAARQVAAATHADPQQTVVTLVRPGTPVDSPQGRIEVARVRSRLAADPGVALVLDSGSVPGLVSRNGRSTYLVAETRPMSDKGRKDVATRLESSFAGDPRVILGGQVVGEQQVQDQVTKDLGRAELLAAIVLVPLLIIVFGSAVSALMPLMVGVLTILTTFLGLRLVNQATDLSIFALNLVTGLGLGLAIDYSLLMVSRYREEVGRHGYVADAVLATVATAGRTVLFSSMTVAAALAALLVFPQQFLYSMGVGGLLVTLSGATIALTLLPAVLLLLGPRIERLRVRRPPDASRHGGWYRLSRAVMRHPAAVAVVSAAVLVVAGMPFLGIRFTSVDSSVLPESASARQVTDALHRDFATDASTPVTVAVTAPASMGTHVAGIATAIRDLPGASLVAPPRLVGGDTWVISVDSTSGPLTDQSKKLVDSIRALPASASVRVGGATAEFVDLQASLRNHLPLAVIIVAVVTIVVLFALTGSLVLPLKSVVMNALSLSAAFGLLVLVFQDGRLTGLLHYESQGALESTQPILLFAIAFGLSTDYGVFLLSRIKEEHDAGFSTHEAVAGGLERTGRVVTAAAALFCVAIGVFATSSIVFIKELGVGTALAVVIDASVVRAFLVPSLMALLGRWNWWAPPPLRGLHRRLHLDRLEGRPVAA